MATKQTGKDNLPDEVKKQVEELTKKLEASNAAMVAVAKALDLDDDTDAAAVAKAAAEKAEAAKAAEEAAAKTKDGGDKTITLDKSKLDPEIRAHVESLEKANAETAAALKESTENNVKLGEKVEKIERERLEKSVAEKLAKVPMPTAERDQIVKDLCDLPDASRDLALKQYERMGRIAETSDIFRSIGTDGDGESADAREEVTRKARELIEKDDKLTLHMARARVLSADSDLAGRYNEAMQKSIQQ